MSSAMLQDSVIFFPALHRYIKTTTSAQTSDLLKVLSACGELCLADFLSMDLDFASKRKKNAQLLPMNSIKMITVEK